ncbi:chemotaxis protein CheW [Microvirga terrae]|uniref:Chemotaxis protein CheW n=1 Tax=Microvirga terrae TaxID=2740529 RepID=A0ABY5RNJ4_9HYPH|nr:chemotaxis protein CheW [Microvirga terrae]UVF17589.1 chemotaxis protein CheW [Microvirga terrae]
MAEKAPSPASQALLTVEVDGERFAFPASDVAEVIRPPAVSRVPLAPSSLVGVANLRGLVLPVVSLRSLMGRPAGSSVPTRVVVVDRGAPIGFEIDKVASWGASGVEGAPDTDSSTSASAHIDLDALLSRNFGHYRGRVHHGREPTVPGARETSLTAPDEVALVCFAVSGQDFALPLDSVHEIVAVPSGSVAVPQADSVMLGVVSRRGHLMPLVSLRGLLGLPLGRHDDARSRVVVARVGDALVGLVADGIKEVLRLPSGDMDPVPAILTRGAAEAKIQRICRLDGGRRLVSVLSTDNLFRDQALAELVAPQMETNPEMSSPDASPNCDEQFIVFQLGDEEYGLPIAAVEEVVRAPDTLSRLPRAPTFIEGVMNLRGRVVPVIDQRRRFEIEGAGEGRRERIVVVTIDDLQAGFIVDAVSEVLRIPQDQLRPTPELAAGEGQTVHRIANIETEGRMILLLDPHELLDRAEKDLIASFSSDHLDRVDP